MCFDRLGIESDDSKWDEDHVLFLLDKFRAVLLRQKYTDVRRDIPISNYQILTMNTGTTKAFTLDSGYVATKKPIPDIVQLNFLHDSISVTGKDIMQSGFSVIDYYRFIWAGDNPRIRNIVYATMGPDSKIYLKSKSSRIKYLKKIRVIGIFTDTLEASKYLDNAEDYEDPMDQPYPLEESLIPTLIDMVCQFLAPGLYNPEDKVNNASDDLTGISTSNE